MTCVGGRTQWDVGGTAGVDGREVRAPAGVVTCAGKAAREVAAAEGNAALSVQELVLLTRDTWEIADSIDDVREILAQLAARTERGNAAARNPQTRSVSALWGEIVAQRRRSAVAVIGGAP